MDWSDCSDVESVPGTLLGAWVVRGTRVPADAILLNAEDGFSPEEIVADLFPTVPLNAAKRILMFAGRYEPRLAR